MIYNYVLSISLIINNLYQMPFIYRTLNRFPNNPSPIEPVKQEDHSIEVEEESIISPEENAI